MQFAATDATKKHLEGGVPFSVGDLQAKRNFLGGNPGSMLPFSVVYFTRRLWLLPRGRDEPRDVQRLSYVNLLPDVKTQDVRYVSIVTSACWWTTWWESSFGVRFSNGWKSTDAQGFDRFRKLREGADEKSATKYVCIKFNGLSDEPDTFVSTSAVSLPDSWDAFLCILFLWSHFSLAGTEALWDLWSLNPEARLQWNTTQRRKESFGKYRMSRASKPEVAAILILELQWTMLIVRTVVWGMRETIVMEVWRTEENAEASPQDQKGPRDHRYVFNYDPNSVEILKWTQLSCNLMSLIQSCPHIMTLDSVSYFEVARGLGDLGFPNQPI